MRLSDRLLGRRTIDYSRQRLSGKSKALDDCIAMQHGAAV